MHRHRSHTSGRATIGHDRARGSSDHGSNERGRVRVHVHAKPILRSITFLQKVESQEGPVIQRAQAVLVSLKKAEFGLGLWISETLRPAKGLATQIAHRAALVLTARDSLERLSSSTATSVRRHALLVELLDRRLILR